MTMAGPQFTPNAAPPWSSLDQAALSAVENQFRVTSWPYHSSVKFFVLRANASPGPYVYLLNPPANPPLAFSYGRGQPKLSAGYTTADGNATPADTNLVNANQTIGGQDVLISGIALQVMPVAMHLNDGQAPPHRIRRADQMFLAALWHSLSVDLVLNGEENTFRLGTPGMVPGAGGLTGQGYDSIGLISLAGENNTIGYPANGFTNRGNFFATPEGLVWRNQGNADSQLNIRFSLTRAIQLFSGGSPENNIAGSGVDTVPSNVPAVVATGTQGYIYPTELAIEIKVFLVGRVIGPRSRAA